MTTSITTLAPPAPPGNGVTYRRYRGLEELAGMAAANQRLRTQCGQLQPINLEGMRHYYTHLVTCDPLVDCILAEAGGRTVGYARTDRHDLVDGDRAYEITCVVEPAAWGLGITDAFLDWSEARLRETAATLPTDRRTWYGTSSFDGDEELEACLAVRGYEAVRWDVEMARPTMEDLPEVPALPAGYAIRPVRMADMPVVSAMVVEAFREHWGQTEASGNELAEWIEDPRFDVDLVCVVWHGEAPAACVSIQLQEHADGGVMAYVDGVSTHPAHRRRGLARAALAEGLHRVADRGVTRAFLGVDTDNHNRAFALYEDAGFRKVTGETSWRKPFTKEEPAP
jgi:ribosomal protein S18 acetylase RimI-like enzyme